MKNLTMSSLMRFIGGGALISSTVHYMINGHYDLNSLDVHYLFLGLNLLLCALGFYFAKKLNEFKSSLTFLSLSLAMVPAQFAQLGGFIFSKVNGIAQNIPLVLQMSLPGDSSLILLGIITFLVLCPIVLIGFSVRNRVYAHISSALYVLQSLLLLIPVRSEPFVLSIITVMMGINYFQLRFWKEKKSLDKCLGPIVNFIPLALVIGRNLIHGSSDVFVGYLNAIAALIIFIFSPQFFKDKKMASRVQGVSAFFGLVSISYFADSLPGLELSALYAGYVLLLQIMSYKCVGSGRVYRLISQLPILLLTCTFINGAGILVHSLALFIPVLSLIQSISLREKEVFYLSLLSSFGFFFALIVKISNMIDFSAWVSTALGGIILIMLAGVYDKRQEKIKTYFNDFISELN